jgi:uncharacterized protein YkwD
MPFGPRHILVASLASACLVVPTAAHAATCGTAATARPASVSTATAVHATLCLWIHSPGHRANILRSTFRDIGIGIANGAPERDVGGAATYTTDFGEPA